MAVVAIIGAVATVGSAVAGIIGQGKQNAAAKEQAAMNEEFQKKTESAEIERITYQASNSVNNAIRSIRF